MPETSRAEQPRRKHPPAPLLAAPRPLPAARRPAAPPGATRTFDARRQQRVEQVALLRHLQRLLERGQLALKGPRARPANTPLLAGPAPASS